MLFSRDSDLKFVNNLVCPPTLVGGNGELQMKIAFCAVAALTVFATPAANAAVTINIVQTAGGVVATTSGSLDTTGLVSAPDGTNSIFINGERFFFTGKGNTTVNAYAGLVGPFFGDFTTNGASSSSGTPFGFNLGNNRLYIMQNYVSGAAINAVTNYQFATLDSLSLYVGSYLYTIGSERITLNIGQAAAAVPEPATWALMLAGFGLIGFAARRRQNVKATMNVA